MSLLNAKEWTEMFRKIGAFWLHDGNLKRPHARLTSGQHSDGFFNGGIVCQDPILLDQVCFDLTLRLRDWSVDFNTIDWAIGPAMGAITLADNVARHLSNERSSPVLCSYTEKKTGTGKEMMFKRTTLKPGDRVLLVEDTLTTGESVEFSAQAVREAGGVVLPWVAVILNRSGLKEVNGRPIISLIEHHMRVWESHDCDLCKRGSEAIRAKEAGNWARLTAT